MRLTPVSVVGSASGRRFHVTDWLAILPAVMLAALMLLCIVQAREVSRLQDMLERITRGDPPKEK